MWLNPLLNAAAAGVIEVDADETAAIHGISSWIWTYVNITLICFYDPDADGLPGTSWKRDGSSAFEPQQITAFRTSSIRQFHIQDQFTRDRVDGIKIYP